MLQLRYPRPAYRELGSTKSLIRKTMNQSPRAAQMCREVSFRVEELMSEGLPDDPEIIAEDPVIEALAAEIEGELWSRKA